MEKKIKFFKDFIVVSRQEGRKDAELVYIFPERLFLLQKGMMKAKQMKPGLLIEVNLPV